MINTGTRFLVEFNQSVVTVLFLDINVALSTIPCPVGGAGVTCLKSNTRQEMLGVRETNLFSR